MKTIFFLLAIVGILPLISSGTKSIHDWAHELGNKLGPGYSFREVEREGRTCICSTTTAEASTSLPGSTEVPDTTAGKTTAKSISLPGTTVVPVPSTSTEEVVETTTELAQTTQVDVTTEEPATTTEKATTQKAATTTEKAATTTEKAATTTEKAATTTENVPTTEALDETTTVPPTTTFSTIQNFGNIFGARSIKCDDNVVPVANDRNAATKYSFSTPLYPDEYPENTCCLWRIIYPEEWMRQGSARIVTYNYSPDSFLPEECNSDFVTVFDITASNRLVEREEKCGHIGGQLGIIKHDGDERGAAFRVCRDEERAGAVKDRSSESTGKVAISFTVVAF